MARPRNSVPSYRKHKQSGQAIVTVRLPGGKRKDIVLGAWNSAESKKEYTRIIAEIQAAPSAIVRRSTKPLVGFLMYSDSYYLDQHGRRFNSKKEYRRYLDLCDELATAPLLSFITKPNSRSK